MKKFTIVLLLVVWVSVWGQQKSPQDVEIGRAREKKKLVQEERALTLSMRRNFGYSSGTGKVQGTFTLKASGPDDLSRVIFLMDGEQLGEVSQAPFEYRLVTDEHPLGNHTLSAVGYTAAGAQLLSNEIHAEFVPAEEGYQAAIKIMFPLLGIVLVVMVLSFVVSFLGARKHKDLPMGTPREYGLAGGAICPRCSRPYPRHALAPNMLLGKLERCPFCGKWAVVPAVPMDLLRAAEQAELADSSDEVLGQSEEDRLRKSLEDSRYQDL